MKMFRPNILATILFVTVILGACSSHSVYTPAYGSGYGYKELKISEQRYRIVFRSRGSDAEQTLDLALLRAAELSLQKGFDWFEVVDTQKKVNEKSLAISVQIEIWMDKGVRPDSKNSYLAKEVADNLREQLLSPDEK